jgi:hypothetical protein
MGPSLKVLLAVQRPVLRTIRRVLFRPIKVALDSHLYYDICDVSISTTMLDEGASAKIASQDLRGRKEIR